MAIAVITPPIAQEVETPRRWNVFVEGKFVFSLYCLTRKDAQESAQQLIPSDYKLEVKEGFLGDDMLHPETLDENHPRAGGEKSFRRRAAQKQLGDFARACVHDRQRIVKTAMAEATGATGGFTVPVDFLMGVDAKLQERSLFHHLAWNQPMGSNVVQVASIDLTKAHATGVSPILGGMQFQWTQEGTTLTETEPSFAGGVMTADNLEGYAVVSNQLVADGGEALGAYLEEVFARGIQFFVERACFQGSGAGQPIGILNAPATAKVNRQTASTVTQQDLANMAGALLPACFGNAVWACSLSALAKIANISSYLANLPAIDGGQLAGFLLGRPLYVTENLPAVGTTGDVMLFDPTLYVLGRRNVQIDVSRHVNFLNNQTVYRIWWRGSGQPIVNNTITLADGSTTGGCFVALN